MIPSVLARQIEQGIKDFLSTTFHVTTPFFHGMLEQFLNTPGELFKGPYLSVNLPFRQGTAESQYFFPEVPAEFVPFEHQENAFKRLSAPNPAPTIIATGTGSGKTECFTYPILDYCRRHIGQPGIKAVLIYPMNALAYDQAARLAKFIWNTPALKGKITAGMYVGQAETSPQSVMTENAVISDKGLLRGSPPDILMTNYKMLDYLMTRPRDAKLWEQNGPETLRYIVVDELHTFDGAQGTDLACLLRRLKTKLGAPAHYVCPVGTSATLGGKESIDRLCGYAEKIFGEPFAADAVVRESKKTSGEFIAEVEGEDAGSGGEVDTSLIPPPDHYEALLPESYPDYPSWMRSQVKLWTGMEVPEEQWNAHQWRVELGEALKRHLFFRNLLQVLDGQVRHYDTVLSGLTRTANELQSGDLSYRNHLANSMIALICEARTGEPSHPRPFLHVRIQHWFREMRRMVVSVEETPRIRFSDDLTDGERHRHLPAVHCRECGLMGWAGKSPLHGSRIDTDLQSIYVEFFKSKRDKRLYFVFPVNKADSQDSYAGSRRNLCPACIHINREIGGNCVSCGSDRKVLVDIPEQVSHDCPSCGAKNSLTLMGSQAASLTSVMIGQLFASNFNDDKKLLAFSDNVQDAAHRAAFYGARTYRFTFRTALQQFVENHGQGRNLVELADQFVDHWRSKLTPEHFVALFVAPNMTWMRDFEHLKLHDKLPQNSRLADDVGRRLRWEIYSEYGFSARIGRTLEKSGGSVLCLDEDRFASATEAIHEALKNELEPFRRVKENEVAAFILGLVTAMRQQGGIFHPALEKYIETWGKTYHISQHRIRWMPRFGPITRAPGFVTTKPDVDRFPRLMSRQGRPTWYEWWASLFFPQLAMPHANLVDNFFEILFTRLEKAGIIRHRFQDQHYIWGLEPEALRVRTDVIQYRCSRCGHILPASGADAGIWTQMFCFRRNCFGFYQEEYQGLDYYGHLYSNGDIRRLYTEEHTGLLERTDRQNLEDQFKKPEDERKPWYPNLLSSTPTLEMGIDIGDLSTTVQCSVPPGQANYLQRIGRSGRKDGNGLNLTVAAGRSHDLYFYNDPLEMIAGEIQPPGVFLDASAVLERQFTAYCFDCWIRAGIPEEAIPPKLGTVLNLLPQNKPDQFPGNLIRFVTARQTELFDGFVQMFGRELSPESITHLEQFVYGGSQESPDLASKILERLHELQKDRKALKAKVDQLYREISKIKANPARDRNYEDTLNGLKMERSGLQTLIKKINTLDTFNFFTDEGLLPNYAFPESGVVLNSIIYRKTTPAGEGEKHYESKSFTYERPSAAGIRELAPNNAFYADGRRVVIDKVDLRISEVEAWRMCETCPHMEREALAKEHLLCPACSSSLWSDQGRRQELLRLRQVYANTPDYKSRIADERDEREPVFYTTNLLVATDERAIIDAYQINDPQCPFGFEFHSRATLREINFGPCGKTSKKVRIAGQEMERPGFMICKRCGKVQNNNGDIEHDYGCPAKNKDDEKNIIDCLYLYREIISEAIKVLLPVSGYEGSERRLNSFVAALHLGLKHHFGGSAYAIEHLQSTVSDEPVTDANINKKYLVLYDTVRGGTGFLKQLMRTDTLIQVLEKALSTLQHCKCQLDPEKDGCYACLFAYRNSYTMATTSRETAIDMLSSILKHKDKFQQVDNLKNLSVTGLLDSELEALFLEGLRRLRKKGFQVDLKKAVVNGKPGYYLGINDQAYEIEPQVELSPADGVAVHSRADFVFRPARSTQTIKPIAVFTDGFIFHRNRVGLDLAQRLAIVQSGAFHVWSVTWKDVNAQLNQHGQAVADFLHPEKSTLGSKTFFQLLDKYGLEEFRRRHALDNFSLLASFLSNPDEAAWQRYSFLQAVSFLDIQAQQDEAVYRNWLAELAQGFPDHFTQGLKNDETEAFVGKMEAEFIQVYFWAQKQSLQNSNVTGVQAFGLLKDDGGALEKDAFEKQWINYLRLYNLFQFLPGAAFIAQSGMDRGYYFELKSPLDAADASREVTDRQGDPAADEADQPWHKVFELTDVAIHPLLRRLQAENVTAPDVGYEIVIQGEVAGEAELAWPEQQAAYLTEEQMTAADTFRNTGWTITPLSELMESAAG